MKVDWDILKTFIDSKGLSPQFIELPGKYIIKTFDGPFELDCLIQKTDPVIVGSEQEDFEDNYKADGNKKMQVSDPDFRQEVRPVAAKKGWAYLAHEMELETSKLNSVYSKNWEETDRADYSLKFYDSSNVEITSGVQADLDSNCVKTVLTLSPDYDYELIGGTIRQMASPLVDVRMWVIGGAVELGAAGTKEFVSGVNFCYFSATEHVETDGRTSKYMKKTTTGVPYNTNQLQFIMRHPAGTNHKLMIVMEYFRA